MDNREVLITGVYGIPEIHKGDDLSSIIMDAVDKQGLQVEDEDIIVVTHKIVSKAEGHIINLSKITPSSFAYNIAEYSKKDPRNVEIILQESKRIVKMKDHHLIVEHRIGHICANAGIDNSNVEADKVVMLPEDPDRSASKIREGIEKRTKAKVAVIITDTWGRPFRKGQINIALGVSGLEPLKSYVGRRDKFGKKLKYTIIAIADEIASASELVMAKTKDIPVALIKGYRYKYNLKKGNAKLLIRDPEKDLFA
jgi:coenzyme F420-0:L-glutamate ligase/coenzyme F420-1:gamma-L-glutamate ligase